MKDPKRNKCVACEKQIEDPKIGINCIWWPTSLRKRKLCKKCAEAHLMPNAFSEYFNGEKSRKGWG